MKKRISGKKKWLILLILFTAAVLLYIALTAVSIWRYGLRDEKTRADAAIILGAGSWNGEVSPVFRERINHGIWLYQNQYVQKLIMTGGLGEGNTLSDAYAAKCYAVSQGVPAEDILIEETSRITKENLENAKAIMDEYHFSTAILVSDPLHMKRAMLMARDVRITAFSSPTPTTRYISLSTKLKFLRRELFYYIGYQIYRILF